MRKQQHTRHTRKNIEQNGENQFEANTHSYKKIIFLYKFFAGKMKKKRNSYLIHLILFVLSAVFFLCLKKHTPILNRARAKKQCDSVYMYSWHAVSFSKYTESVRVCVHIAFLCVFSKKKSDAVYKIRRISRICCYATLFFITALNVVSHSAHCRSQKKGVDLSTRTLCFIVLLFFPLYFTQLLLQLSSTNTIHPLS